MENGLPKVSGPLPKVRVRALSGWYRYTTTEQVSFVDGLTHLTVYDLSVETIDLPEITWSISLVSLSMTHPMLFQLSNALP